MLLIIILILLLFPGIYAYISGRKFVSLERTKAFASLYFKYQQRSAMAFWICLLMSFMAVGLFDRPNVIHSFIKEYTGGFGFLLLFFVSYSLFIIGFSRINRIVRDEYVPIFKRIKFNILHLYLLVWPYVFLASVAFNSDPGIRTAFIIILYGTMYFLSFDIWRILMRARPLGDPALLSRFNDITDNAGLQPIPMYIFPAEGLKFANAFFIGTSGAKKGVFMSRYAYENLTVDEVTATYAHEIGHGQTHQVMRRSLALVVPFLGLIAFNIGFKDPHFLMQIAALISAFIIMKLFIQSQRFEKEADLFALKATNDAEAVVSGLEKIYNLGILPERFAPSEEKRLSHPSLVKRKTYIREAAGEEIPKFSEPVTLQGMDSEPDIIFYPDDFVIKTKEGTSTRYKYHEVTSMHPRMLDGHTTEITVRFTSSKQKMKITTPYEEVVDIIDTVAHRFSAKQYTDPGRFKRTYYIWTTLTTFFGLIFAFIIGPALLILGITSLVKRRKTMLMSIGMTSILYFLYPYINRYHYDEILKKEYTVVFGLIGVICLFDYLGIRKFEEKMPGKGSISFGFTIFFTLIAFGALIALIVSQVWGQDPFSVYGTYSMMFYNALVLAIGLVISCRLYEMKRKILLIANILMLCVFSLINLL